MKLRKISTDKLKDDKMLSQLKTTLFEFKDENLELRLDSVESMTNSAGESKFEDTCNELHGRWLIVNGNKLKKDSGPKNSTCIYLFLFFFVTLAFTFIVNY